MNSSFDYLHDELEYADFLRLLSIPRTLDTILVP